MEGLPQENSVSGSSEAGQLKYRIDCQKRSKEDKLDIRTSPAAVEFRSSVTAFKKTSKN